MTIPSCRLNLLNIGQPNYLKLGVSTFKGRYETIDWYVVQQRKDYSRINFFLLQSAFLTDKLNSCR